MTKRQLIVDMKCLEADVNHYSRQSNENFAQIELNTRMIVERIDALEKHLGIKFEKLVTEPKIIPGKTEIRYVKSKKTK